MKIALIAPSYIPSRRANTIQTMKMAQAFTHQGHQVLLIVPGETAKFSWEELSQHYGLSTQFEIEWMRSTPFWRRYDFAYIAVKRAKKWQADLAFTRVPQSAAIASNLGIPTIFEIHDFPGGRIGPLLVKRFLNGKGAKALISITKALAKHLQEEFDIPDSFITIAPDGVDIDRYQNLPSSQQARKLLKLQENFTVGYTGHLYPGRGSELILEIAKGLPEVNFLVVGGNPKDINLVQEQVNHLGLKNINLTGFIPNAELPTYQAASDILLMPYQNRVSASGGGNIAKYLSPMKMFEYLASQRPIISSDLSVLQEVLNPDNAVILPIDQPEFWAKEITNLIVDESRRINLSKNARLTAEKYSWNERALQVLSSLK